VDTLYGLPNGKALKPRPGNPNFETHGPYQHGNGFKTVDDSDGALHLFQANVPPNLRVGTSTGVTLPGVFASEFGCVGMSSFESMSVTLSAEHWSLHTPAMAQRNYPCDNIIEVYWGKQNLDLSGEGPFKRQLYQCLIGQALELKSDIEVRRSTNEFGTVTWQLNEIWPTGGWGSIEYGTPVPGQVIGGRWKPLHHWFESSVFSDVAASCASSDPPKCFIKNDSPVPFSGSVNVALVRFSDGKATSLTTETVSLPAGAGVTHWFCAKSTGGSACTSWADIYRDAGCAKGAVDCILTADVTGKDGVLASNNVVALSTPQSMILPAPTISWTVDASGSFTLKTNAVAVFVTLTTKAQGRFSDNAFLLLPGTKKVQFISFGALDLPTLQSTTRLEHVQLYNH